MWQFAVLGGLPHFYGKIIGYVIDGVQVYSEKRIEIVWKVGDWFFSEVVRGLRYRNAEKVIIQERHHGAGSCGVFFVEIRKSKKKMNKWIEESSCLVYNKCRMLHKKRRKIIR